MFHKIDSRYNDFLKEHISYYEMGKYTWDDIIQEFGNLNLISVLTFVDSDGDVGLKTGNIDMDYEEYLNNKNKTFFADRVIIKLNVGGRIKISDEYDFFTFTGHTRFDLNEILEIKKTGRYIKRNE